MARAIHTDSRLSQPLVSAALLTGLAPLGALASPVSGPPVLRGAFLDPDIALTVFACTALWFFIYWLREQRLREQRRGLRSLYQLSEEIISARTPAEIVRRLSERLPKITNVSVVHLYLYNRQTETLDLQPVAEQEQALSMPVGQPRGVPVCFRNKSLLAIPDPKRSPLYEGDASDPPGAVIYVPMQAEQEILGVLEIRHAEGIPRFNLDQQTAAQHLGNQIAIALRLLERQSMQEQLFRSEKLAAAGQLVSGVVNELQTPLESAATRAKLLRARHEDSLWQQDLEAIATETGRAAEIVSRLISFTKTRKPQAKRVNLNRLVESLTSLREQEWELTGVDYVRLLSDGPLMVLAAENQIQQVLLNLLVHAEQSMANAVRKELSVTTRKISKNASLTITWTAPGQVSISTGAAVRETQREAAHSGLAVCRGIIESHGGNLRFIESEAGESRAEMELPLAPEMAGDAVAYSPASRKCGRRLTVLLIENEIPVERHLMALLGGRGHRIVPTRSAEQAMDLIARLKFDLVFCSISIPGLNWLEFHGRINNRAGEFILLCDGGSHGLRAALAKQEASLLQKPVDEIDFEQLMDRLETRADPQTVNTRGG